VKAKLLHNTFEPNVHNEDGMAPTLYFDVLPYPEDVAEALKANRFREGNVYDFEVVDPKHVFGVRVQCFPCCEGETGSLDLS